MPYPFAPFNPWMISNPTLPKLYWEVKSPEQLVANLYCIVNALKDYVNSQSEQINLNTDDIEQLEKLFQKFVDSGFEEHYEELLKEWIDAHMPDIIAAAIKMVFFGLTDDGYFCAYIPDSWSDIVFDTGAVYGTEQYGRLILRYNVNGEGVIDNTAPTYPYDSPIASIEKMAADIKMMKKTLYTAITKAEFYKGEC